MAALNERFSPTATKKIEYIYIYLSVTTKILSLYQKLNGKLESSVLTFRRLAVDGST